MSVDDVSEHLPNPDVVAPSLVTITEGVDYIVPRETNESFIDSVPLGGLYPVLEEDAIRIYYKSEDVSKYSGLPHRPDLTMQFGESIFEIAFTPSWYYTLPPNFIEKFFGRTLQSKLNKDLVRAKKWCSKKNKNIKI